VTRLGWLLRLLTRWLNPNRTILHWPEEET
jgi:hypothetical protein